MIKMFDKTKPIYSAPDNRFAITFKGNRFMLDKEDAELHYPGLWEEVIAFIDKNPDVVQPLPPPLEPPPYIPQPNYIAIMQSFIDGLIETAAHQ